MGRPAFVLPQNGLVLRKDAPIMTERKLLLSMAGLVAIAVPVVFSQVTATAKRASVARIRGCFD